LTFWTHYWTGPTVEDHEVSLGMTVMDHTAGNQFRSRGVQVGDIVYMITYSAGNLRVLRKLTVHRIVNMSQARRALRYEPWDAEDHLLAEPNKATPIRYDAVVPHDQLDDIEFVSSGGLRAIKRNRRGEPDPQTFRSVREITAATATLFDQVLTARPQKSSTRRSPAKMRTRTRNGRTPRSK
jgi:hypothetical protein